MNAQTLNPVAYGELLAKVQPRPIKDEREYDRKHYPLSPSQPHKMVAFLLEQRGLEPHDLWPVLGSKGRVSEMLSGRRAISKAHAKKLAAFFHVPIDLFI